MICYLEVKGLIHALWYRRAADAGQVDAQISLGYCYDNGLGVGADATQAALWYRRAADAGNATAQYNLGCFYDTGEGVEADALQAAMWFHRAADAGSVDAKAWLTRCS